MPILALLKLGFRSKKKTPIQQFFDARKRHAAVKPDVDYPNHDERTPQAPRFTGMWLDHWSHWGDVKNPVGSPMESGA
jgi:hypothetical protein